MAWSGEVDRLTEEIIGAAIEVHRELGPGLLESVYQCCLARELTLRGLDYDTEVALPIDYKGVTLDAGYRADFIVEKAVLLELKTVQALLPIHEAQLLTYLRLSGVKRGLLLNFKEVLLKDGIKRMQI